MFFQMLSVKNFLIFHDIQIDMLHNVVEALKFLQLIIILTNDMIVTLQRKHKERNQIAINPIYQPLRSGRIWHMVNF